MVISIRVMTSTPSTPSPTSCSHLLPQIRHLLFFSLSPIKGSATERNTTKEVLNNLRVLQRVLLVIFELGGEPRVFGREVLRKRDVIEGAAHREQVPSMKRKEREDSESVRYALRHLTFCLTRVIS
jgi:hypothetical protein